MDSTAIRVHRPHTLADLIARRRPVRNANTEHAASMTGLERVAIWITEHVGTMGFFLVVVVWTTLWLAWNFLAPKHLQFDPPMAFVFWLFISNVLQIFLMPLIMVGQNMQGRHAEIRAESDFEINIKAEQEVETILQHLEVQQAILLQLVQAQGIKLDEALAARCVLGSASPGAAG